MQGANPGITEGWRVRQVCGKAWELGNGDRCRYPRIVTIICQISGRGNLLLGTRVLVMELVRRGLESIGIVQSKEWRKEGNACTLDKMLRPVHHVSMSLSIDRHIL